MGFDLVICNPIPVYGEFITGVVMAGGAITTLAGVLLNNPVVSAIGMAVTVYTGLSIAKCYDKPLGAIQEAVENLAAPVAKKFIEENIKPQELVESAMKTVVGEAVESVVK